MRPIYETVIVLNPVPQSYERLFKFSRLMCSMDFDYVMEGLQYESELKQKVIKMQVSARFLIPLDPL